MTKIITVHGTNAGHPDDRGDKWWQIGSPFLENVQQYLGEKLDITPFHWSGKNSEIARRRAGEQLDDVIAASDEPPIVIGHSHGGSSTVHALLRQKLRDKTGAIEAVRGFISVGMPMIRFRSNRNPMSWFDLRGRISLIAIFGMLALFFLNNVDVASEDPASLLVGQSSGFFSFLPPTEIVIAIIAAICFFWFVRLNFVRQRLFGRNALSETLDVRHAALNHDADEAINALREGLKLKPKMIRGGTMFVGVFSTVAMILVAYIYTQTIGSEVARRAIDFDNAPPALSLPSSYATGFGTPVTLNEDIVDERPRMSYFLRRFETTEELYRYALSDLLPVVEPETAASWLATEYPFIAENMVYYVPYGDEARLFSEVQEAVYELKNAYDANSADDFDEANIAKILISAGALVSFDEDETLLFSDFDGGEYLDRGTAILTPLSTAIDVEWACAPDINLDQFAYIQELSEKYCASFNFGDLSGIDYVFVPLTDVAKRVEAFLMALDDSAIFAPVRATGFDIGVILETIVLLAPIFVICTIIAIIGMVIGTPLANSFLVSTIKGAAYGNDGYGERPVSVTPSLDFKDKIVGTLPDSVQEEMNRNSDRDAPAALMRFRNLLASGKLTSGDTDADALSIAMQFDKSELLHNAYFHSDLFVKYFAALLVERFGVAPSQAYNDDKDIAKFAAALKSG